MPQCKGWVSEGMAAAWPICLGYVPIGLAFGVLAQKAGLSPLQIGMMSMLVFAGSSQFIAVSMLVDGAVALSVITTTFLVNLRHLLMSSSLAMFLQRCSRLKLTLFAYGITDESFAVNHSRFSAGPWEVRQALLVNHVSNAAWIVSTVLGGIGGQYIPAHAFGIDYALIAMFICLLVFQLKSPLHWLTAGVSGALALGLVLIVPGNVHIMVASCLAAGVGAVLKHRFARSDMRSARRSDDVH